MWSSAVDRMACIDVPALPLQILLLRCPDWRGLPAAVVDQDKPQGLLLWVNEAARQSQVLPGQRYAAALALEPELRAGVVPEVEIGQAVEALLALLWRFSPRVEPAADEPGVFYLDAMGLLPLYRSYHDWLALVQAGLEEEGFRASVVLGFGRFACYAAARSGPDLSLVFDHPAEEAAFCAEVSIHRLGFKPRLRDRLLGLGVERLGQFLALPAEGLRRRLGAEAAALHRQAQQDTQGLLQPRAPRPVLRRHLVLERPDASLSGLLTTLEGMLAELCQALRRQQLVLIALTVELVLDDGGALSQDLEPAAPTLDQDQVMQLLALRLGQQQLSAGVVELSLSLRGVAGAARQLGLFDAPARDLRAAGRALARLRAAFGDATVQQAVLREGHLPEAQFGLRPLRRLVSAGSPAGLTGPRPLVRRVFDRPVPLPFRSRHEPDGWHLTDADGPVEEVQGPYLLQGGWWVRELQREYYYVRTRSGRWLWIYHDHSRRRWLLHGEVE